MSRNPGGWSGLLSLLMAAIPIAAMFVAATISTAVA
jgi:hypothetical protein